MPVVAMRCFTIKDITEESYWDCGICFNSAPIWSAAAQPSYQVSKFGKSLHLLTAAENANSDDKKQPSGTIRCLHFLLFYAEKTQQTIQHNKVQWINGLYYIF